LGVERNEKGAVRKIEREEEEENGRKEGEEEGEARLEGDWR
jgi:hypothetical protein